jgi:hypothetical protein
MGELQEASAPDPTVGKEVRPARAGRAQSERTPEPGKQGNGAFWGGSGYGFLTVASASLPHSNFSSVIGRSRTRVPVA